MPQTVLKAPTIPHLLTSNAKKMLYTFSGQYPSFDMQNNTPCWLASQAILPLLQLFQLRKTSPQSRFKQMLLKSRSASVSSAPMMHSPHAKQISPTLTILHQQNRSWLHYPAQGNAPRAVRFCSTLPVVHEEITTLPTEPLLSANSAMLLIFPIPL